MSIESWRKKIDRIDDQILILLNIRASCAIEIGKIKRLQNIPVYSPEREKEILERLVANSPGPMTEHSIKTLFERIIDESRRTERITIEGNE